MTKFLTLCAACLVFVSTAVAMPQNLAPEVHSKEAASVLNQRDVTESYSYATSSADVSIHARSTPEPSMGVDSGPATMSIYERQEQHNADYGSNGGPTGNPQAAPATTAEAQSPTPAAQDKTDSKKRRQFTPKPSNDINYSDHDS